HLPPPRAERTQQDPGDGGADPGAGAGPAAGPAPAAAGRRRRHSQPRKAGQPALAGSILAGVDVPAYARAAGGGGTSSGAVHPKDFIGRIFPDDDPDAPKARAAVAPWPSPRRVAGTWSP